MAAGVFSDKLNLPDLSQPPGTQGDVLDTRNLRKMALQFEGDFLGGGFTVMARLNDGSDWAPVLRITSAGVYQVPTLAIFITVQVAVSSNAGTLPCWICGELIVL